MTGHMTLFLCKQLNDLSIGTDIDGLYMCNSFHNHRSQNVYILFSSYTTPHVYPCFDFESLMGHQNESHLL